MPTERRAGIACIAALVAGIAWVHAPGTNSLTAHHDNLDGAAPLRVEAARQWRAGAVPLWNPWKRSGMPLLADTTAGALYPGNAPFLFLETSSSDGGSPVFGVLDRVAAINAMLGGLFMYVFLRALALAPLACAFGGLVFACGGTLTWFAAWYIQIQSSAVWLPLILAAVHRLASSRDAAEARANPAATFATWTTVGAAAVALQFFAGFPETSFYSGVLAGVYALWLAASRRTVRPLAGVVSVYFAGLLLAAVQLLPSLELQSLSRRPGALPLEVFQSLPATTDMFRHLVLPSAPAGFEFPPFAAYHVGAVAAAAAVAGAIVFFRRSVFFVVLLVVGVLLSLGATTPMNAWLHAVPLFNAFRHPFKHLFEVSFALSVLAAFGMHWMTAGHPENRSLLRVGAGMFAIAATCVLLRANLAAVAVANPAGVETGGGRPAVAEKIQPGWRVLTPRHVFQKRDPEFLIGDYPSQFEVPAVHGAGPFLWSNMARATGMVEEETTFRAGLFGARDRTLSLLSSRYLVQSKLGNRWMPNTDASVWNVASETAEARLLERRDALPRIRFVASARCAIDEEIRASLEGSAEEPADVALLDCASQPAPAGSFHAPSTLALRVVHESPGTLIAETGVPEGASAFLVIGQSDFPGWHAGTDGRPAVIRRVHGLVQGIELPPGTKRVELAYMPLTFLVGAAMSAATLIVLLLWCLVAWRWKDHPMEG